MITEDIRQQYLQALGIESYLPRRQLPGAAPSSLLASDGADELQVVESAESPVVASQQPVQQDSSPQAVPARPKLEIELEPKQPRATISAEAAQLASQASPAPRFVLGIWQISPQILVLDSRRASLALPVGRLLQNIALALGLDGRLPEPEILRWPLTDAGDFQGTEADARAHVRAFLAARAGLQPIRHILLMGSPAIRFALHEEQLADVGTLRSLLGKSLPLQLEDSTVQAIALPSLAAMLQRPELKAGVWAAIKHLRHE